MAKDDRAITAADILAQDLEAANRRINTLTEQFRRLDRTVRFDEKEAAAGTVQTLRQTHASMTHLAVAVEAMVAQRIKIERGDDPDLLYWQRIQEKRTSSTNRNVEYIRYLDVCRREFTALCSCGKHKGIRFIDQATQRVVEDNMCPTIWYIKKSRLAFAEGTLREFNASSKAADIIGKTLLKNPLT
jgi:hypothetical protein